MRNLVLPILTLCLTATALYAQEVPAQLTLQDCFRLALERNPSLHAARYDVAASKAGLDAQVGRWLPRLNARYNTRVQQSLPRTIQIGGGVVETTSVRSTTHDMGLSLNQTFYQSGLAESIAAARTQLQASNYSLADARRRLLVQVAATFYTVLANQQLADVARKGVEASRMHLEMVDARIQAGTAAPVDRRPVEVELAQARLDAVRTINATWQALADLKALLDLQTPRPLLLEGEFTPPSQVGELDAWLQEALDNRPDLAAQVANVRAAGLALEQARIAAGVTLSATGQLDYGRYSGSTGESWWLAAGASYPLHDKTTRAEVDRAQARLHAARQRLADFKLAVKREVERAWYDLQNATQRVQAAQAAVRAAEANLQAARERYNEGVAIIVEVVDAEQSLRESRASLVQSRYDQVVAYYQLLAAAGRSLFEEPQTLGQQDVNQPAVPGT